MRESPGVISTKPSQLCDHTNVTSACEQYGERSRTTDGCNRTSNAMNLEILKYTVHKQKRQLNNGVSTDIVREEH
jgi:hypothetical protein